MSRIVGVGANKAPRKYTEEKVAKLIADFNQKIAELEAELNVSNETIATLTSERDDANQKIAELEKNKKNKE